MLIMVNIYAVLKNLFKNDLRKIGKLEFCNLMTQHKHSTHLLLLLVFSMLVTQLDAQTYTIGPPDPSIGSSSSITPVYYLIFDVLDPNLQSDWKTVHQLPLLLIQEQQRHPVACKQ